MNKKEFRTLDEQIDILRNKGLTINDEDSAKEILLKENYFFINGYRNILYTKDRKFILYSYLIEHLEISCLKIY